LPADLRTEDYQLRNAALAVLTLEAWRGEALPPEAAWMPALRAARMPGRMQRLDSPDHIPVLLDAAHNPAGAEALAAALSKTPGGARRRVFFSAMRDKDVPAVARALSGISGDLVFVNLSARYPRALSGDEARALLPTEGFPGLRVIRPEGGELEPLLRPGAGAEEAVFCGSLFLLGEVIPLLANFYGGLGEFAQMHREDEGKG
jgi:dihydrofolate synthase/folylpolyglutamate synthase